MTIDKAAVQSVLKPAVMVGGVVIAVSAGAEIWNKISGKSVTKMNWIMPAITVLVGVSAFSYALSGEEIKVLPTGK